MWIEIKKALNSTLGTKNFKPLNEIEELNMYWVMYMYECHKHLMETGNYTLSDFPVITNKVVTKEYVKKLESAFGGGYFPMLPPWIEEIADDAEVRNTMLLPPSIKKIGKNAFYNYTTKDVIIPQSVKEINEEAFSKLRYGGVIINNKKGAISGHPWGHPAGDDGIIYTYE